LPSTTLPRRYHRIRPRPQLPGYAAVLEGFTVTGTLDAETKAELYAALLEFEVLFIPPQPLSDEQHLALAEAFGTIAAGAFFPRKDGHPDIEIIRYDEARKPDLNIWHSDVTWQQTPPTGTVIQLTEVPETGGNTAWASMTKAFAALSPGMQAYLRQVTATHTWENSIVRDALGRAGEEQLIAAIRSYKPVVHPVVTRHPESGKDVLFVNEAFTRHINGVHFRESRALLAFLYEWIAQPEFVYSHRWEKNGIAVWDNRTTQHYALADYYPQQRTVQRVTFNAR
jgi:taurine dioxygenase